QTFQSRAASEAPAGDNDPASSSLSLDSDCIELEPSQLGRRDYWERFYGQELANYLDEAAANDEEGGSGDDRGEVWFGAAAEQRLVSYVERRLNAIRDACPTQQLAVVDIGCGNGHLALRLAANSHLLTGLSRLLCLDYSEPAIELTNRLASKAGVSDLVIARLLDVTEPGAAASALEFLRAPDSNIHYPNLLLLDKGTYDAISLCPDNSQGKRFAYRQFAVKLLDSVANSNNQLVVASCNWTETELIAQFSDQFKHVETLPGRAFKFGGAVGADVTTVKSRMSAMTTEKLVPESEVTRLVIECMRWAGADSTHAARLAEILLSADRRGHYSHGINRLDVYVRDVRAGVTQGSGEPAILKETA
uniref:Protein-lysine N-methyltransferase n=1 Tax=Macrostomum lignano TaxID=282301 RepID=A0A1I8IGE0_9PLAT